MQHGAIDNVQVYLSEGKVAIFLPLGQRGIRFEVPGSMISPEAMELLTAELRTVEIAAKVNIEESVSLVVDHGG